MYMLDLSLTISVSFLIKSESKSFRMEALPLEDVRRNLLVRFSTRHIDTTKSFIY